MCQAPFQGLGVAQGTKKTTDPFPQELSFWWDETDNEQNKEVKYIVF